MSNETPTQKKSFPTPQVISGNRSKDSLPELVSHFVHAGITNIVIQKGCYDFGNPLTNIAEAHKKCIRHAKRQNWDFCIILEDDVLLLHPKAYQYFIDQMKDLPKDWDVYTAGFYTANSFVQDYKNIYRISGFAGLHLYCVNSNYYDHFLKCPENTNIDQWISGSNGNAKSFCCYPFAAIQKSGFSENRMQDVDYSKLLEGKEIFTGQKFS